MRLSYLVRLLLKLVLTCPQGGHHGDSYTPGALLQGTQCGLTRTRQEKARQPPGAKLSATTLSASQSLRVINGPGGAAVSAPWCGRAGLAEDSSLGDSTS